MKRDKRKIEAIIEFIHGVISPFFAIPAFIIAIIVVLAIHLTIWFTELIVNTLAWRERWSRIVYIVNIAILVVALLIGNGNLALILVSILLFSSAAWFRKSSSSETAFLTVMTRFDPEQKLTSSTSIITNPPSTDDWYREHGTKSMRKVTLGGSSAPKWYREITQRLPKIPAPILLYIFTPSIIGCIYLLLNGQSWAAPLLILLLILILPGLDNLIFPRPAEFHSLPYGLENVTISLIGEALLPNSVYIGDTHNVSIKMHPGDDEVARIYYGRPVQIQDIKGGKKITLKIRNDLDVEQSLEIELQCAGATIDGDKKQKQPLGIRTVYYNWNCYFPNSGNHLLNLVMRVIYQSDVLELGSIEHKVKVVRLGKLTQREVWLIASAGGVLSAIAAILSIISILMEL